MLLSLRSGIQDSYVLELSGLLPTPGLPLAWALGPWVHPSASIPSTATESTTGPLAQKNQLDQPTDQQLLTTNNNHHDNHDHVL